MGIKQGIYQIKNIANDKIYIGSSVDIGHRWNAHKSDLRKGIHGNQHLQYAWDKHGKDTFEFSVIYEVDTAEELIPHEQWCMDIMFPEYNIVPFASSQLGYKHTTESKKKMSASHKGKVVSKETRAKMSKAQKGRIFREGWKRKISESKAGSNNAMSKLTEEQVLEIRHLYASGKYYQKELAKMFNISNSCIGGITRMERWKHVGDSVGD